MEFLRALEQLRTPVGDAFFSVVTHLGEETVFILLGLIFFWCVNKKEGYYLLTVGFFGTIINQFLKLWFRIPRPWVKDENFTIVETARGEASGYSFPSGHTQSSVGIFGGIARWNKNLWVRIICIIICVLVPFSRMYLGVHTPLDVGVSIGVALILIFAIYPVIQKATQNSNYLRILLITMAVLSLGYLCFVSFYNFPSNVDAANLASGTKNAYKMLGCSLGIYIAFEVDERLIKFETTASFLGQALKLVIGLIPVLMIKEGLRAPLGLIFSGYFDDGVRYFILVLFSGCIWPLTFKWFAKKFPKK